MSITILSKELQTALALAKPLCNKHHESIRINNNRATIRSGNHAIEVNFTFLYSSSEEVIVKVSELKRALASYKGNAVTLETVGNKVVVNDRIRIESRAHDKEFTLYPDTKPYEERIEVATSAIVTGIKKVVDYASSEETTPILQCIRFSLRKDEMELLATDRHRLSRYTVNLTEHHHPVVDFNLRASILKPLASLKELPATTAIHYNKHHDYMELRIGENMRIRIHHYNDATYPQTDKIIDGARNHRSWIQFDRSDMTRVLKDLKRHVSNKFKLAVIDLPEDAYSATVADSNIEVTYSADIDMKSNAGQPFIAGFNAEYMLDALDTVDGREVCLQFDDRNATMHPLYMTEQTTTATHDILILPCRLKQPETATASA